MTRKNALSPRLYFSYSQFFVYDKSVPSVGCDWTKAHSDQGFARRESTVAFGTLLEFGHADVLVRREAYEARREYQRVIAVPFCVRSGEVAVEGAEEITIERTVALPPGHYRLVAAQHVTGADNEAIHLYF